ncbi:MAG: site-specific integrase [Muribaculaceae bacterium]|nr:site-specific integrase [Muribaculaceae bacterium]
MTSVKIKIMDSPSGTGEGVVCYALRHRRRTRLIVSDRRVALPVNECDIAVNKAVDMDVARLKRVIAGMEVRGWDYSVDDVAEEYGRQCKAGLLFVFMERVIASLLANGRVRTSETYRAALNSFRRFRSGEDVMIDCLDGAMMEAYQAWLRRRGLVLNTVSFYVRILRAVYNRAVEQGLTADCRPFRHVYTGVDKTVKRALQLPVIRKIKNLDLKEAPELAYARDMFMMSFYLRGMSFVDMAYLRKTDLRAGYIVYRRRKTGRQLVIKWTRAMQQIIDRYPDNNTGYLLPVIRNNSHNERNTYRNTSYNINHGLKRIAELVGVSMPLTMYVARHSWATAAKEKGVPVRVISEGMGHDSEATTQIYLASLDTSVVDRANSLILSSL